MEKSELLVASRGPGGAGTFGAITEIEVVHTERRRRNVVSLGAKDTLAFSWINPWNLVFRIKRTRTEIPLLI